MNPTPKDRPRRQIKFRMWHDNKIRFCHVIMSREGEFNCSRDDEALMQFTGKLDKNGKEVYESDIVEYQFNYDDEKLNKKAKRYLGLIYWDEEHAGWVVGVHRLVFNSGDFLTCEVIGNIHENPELIEKLKEK